MSQQSSDLGVRRAVGLGLVFMGCLVGWPALASDAVPSPLVPVSFAGEAGEIAVAGVRTRLDPILYDVVKQSRSVRVDGFVLGGVAADQLSVDLELEQFDVLTPDAQLVIADGARERFTGRPDMVMLRGTIVGEPASLVFLSLSPRGSNGFIRSERGTFVIADDDNGGAYVYNTKDAGEVVMNIPVCQGALAVPGADQLPAAINDALVAPGAGQARDSGFEATNCRTVRIAVDTDFEYRSISRFTSDEAAQTYAITLWGSVSEIYRRDVNVSLAVPYIRIWSTNTDPYPDGSAIGDRLGQFVSHWRATKGSVSREIAHLLSGTGGGGVAYLTVLCSNTWGYGADGSLSGTFPKPLRNYSAQNWDPMVTAHELGHNFSAPHTHSMNPVVDGCGNGDCSAAVGGTIMSYCHTCAGGMANLQLIFHPRTINEAMLPYLNGSAATCGASLESVQITQSPPAFRPARAGRAIEFEVQATGAQLSYAWTFNTKPLVDGPTLFGSVISGATTSKLTISNLSNKDNGSYRAIVSNACSSATSANGSLSVRCAADTDEDGTVELTDFFAFLNCFDTSESCADMDSSGGVDLGDFFAFLNAFDRGC